MHRLKETLESHTEVLIVNEYAAIRDQVGCGGSWCATFRRDKYDRKGVGSFCFQAEDGIRELTVTGVQTCALPIYVPNGRPRQLSDRSRCLARWKEGKYSTAACGSATERQESFSNFPVRTPDRLLLCYRREREFFASSFRRPSNGRRLAPGSTRRHDQAQRRKLCSGPAGPRGSARSAANHPARYAPSSCRRPWTCTFHSRKKSRSACRLLPSRRK